MLLIFSLYIGHAHYSELDAIQGVPLVTHHSDHYFFLFVADLVSYEEKLAVYLRVELVFMFGRDGAIHRSVAQEFNPNYSE